MEAVADKQEKNESGAISKKTKEVLSRPPKAERSDRAEKPGKEKPLAKENSKSKSSVNERQRTKSAEISSKLVPKRP